MNPKIEILLCLKGALLRPSGSGVRLTYIRPLCIIYFDVHLC